MQAVKQAFGANSSDEAEAARSYKEFKDGLRSVILALKDAARTRPHKVVEVLHDLKYLLSPPFLARHAPGITPLLPGDAKAAWASLIANDNGKA